MMGRSAVEMIDEYIPYCLDNDHYENVFHEVQTTALGDQMQIVACLARFDFTAGSQICGVDSACTIESKEWRISLPNEGLLGLRKRRRLRCFPFSFLLGAEGNFGLGGIDTPIKVFRQAEVSKSS